MGSDATLGGRFGGADLMFRRNFSTGGHKTWWGSYGGNLRSGSELERKKSSTSDQQTEEFLKVEDTAKVVWFGKSPFEQRSERKSFPISDEVGIGSAVK